MIGRQSVFNVAKTHMLGTGEPPLGAGLCMYLPGGTRCDNTCSYNAARVGLASRLSSLKDSVGSRLSAEDKTFLQELAQIGQLPSGQWAPELSAFATRYGLV